MRSFRHFPVTRPGGLTAWSLSLALVWLRGGGILRPHSSPFQKWVQIRAVLLPGDNCRSTTILIANAARGRNASVKDRALETWFSRGFWAPKHAIRSSPGQTRRRRSDQVLPHLRAISRLTASGQQEQAVATGEV